MAVSTTILVSSSARTNVTEELASRIVPSGNRSIVPSFRTNTLTVMG